MKHFTKDDLIGHAEYEQERDRFRRRIIDLKRRRRISLGDHVTLLFENRDTVQFQIQEMIRVERIFDLAKVEDELSVYNALLPTQGELSATLFIEITDHERMKEELDAFMGIDHGKKLSLAAGAQTVYGEFEGGHSSEEKLSAVHFVRFQLDQAFVQALRCLAEPVTVSLHHGGYQKDVVAPEHLRQEWLADLDASA